MLKRVGLLFWWLFWATFSFGNYLEWVESWEGSFEHFFEWPLYLSTFLSGQLLWALFWALNWVSPSFEHCFEWITQKSPFLSTLLSRSTLLNAFLSTQKSGFTQKSTLLSGFTLLSAFLSPFLSTQAHPQPLCSPGMTRVHAVRPTSRPGCTHPILHWQQLPLYWPTPLSPSIGIP